MYESNVTIIGNVGREPEMRYLPSGVPVTDFSVAVNKSYTNGAGEKVESTKWYKITCWRKTAEVVAQYLHKGRLVAVEGEVSAEAYLNKEGKAIPVLKLDAKTVKFLGPKEGGEGAATGFTGEEIAGMTEAQERHPLLAPDHPRKLCAGVAGAHRPPRIVLLAKTPGGG